MKKLLISLVLISCIVLLASQDVIFSEGFNYSDSAWITSGLIDSTNFTVSRSGSDWGAMIDDQTLALSNSTGASPNTQGWVYVHTHASNYGLPYNSVLSENPGVVTWYLNIWQSASELQGFGTASYDYGIAYILAGQGTTKNDLSGYALLIGQSGNDPMRLAKISPVFTYTNIVTSSGDFSDLNTQYLSVKVTYDPALDEWKLYLRDDGNAFADPRAGDLVLQGVGYNSDYTSVELPYMGAYYQGPEVSSFYYSRFDNIAVTLEGGTVPVELTNFRASQYGNDQININWVSQSETGLIGYRVYRSDQNELHHSQDISGLIQATNTSQTQTYLYPDTGLTQSGEYYYWLESVEIDGSSEFHGPVSCLFNQDGNTGEPQIPVETALKGNFPNPFNHSGIIRYTLAEESTVGIRIYDIRGRLVRSFDSGRKSAGEHNTIWDGKDDRGNILPSGVYLIIMEAEGKGFFEKALLQK